MKTQKNKLVIKIDIENYEKVAANDNSGFKPKPMELG